jgi:hypothetical protein
MIDKLIEIGRCYGMEINVEKTKVMRILRPPSPVKFIIDQKQLESVESFKHFGSILTNDGRCTCESTLVTTEQGWRTQPSQHHTITRGCMCSG